MRNVSTRKQRIKQLIPTQIAAGRLANSEGIGEALSVYGNFLTRNQIKYAMKKVIAPKVFHAGTWGGSRNSKFSESTRKLITKVIFYLLANTPTLSPKQICRNFDNVKYKMVLRILKANRWSYRKADVRQMNKYTEANLNRYKNFVSTIGEVPWSKLFYLDESHVEAQTCRTRRCWFKKGKGNNTLASKIPYKNSLSLTLMCGINGITYSMRKDTNSTVDFYFFVYNCFKENRLNKGDVLVVDNATVHSGSSYYAKIMELFEEKEARLLFLPTYSPELNPCELLFALMKGETRKNWSDEPLEPQVHAALQKITPEIIISQYKHCQVTELPKAVRDYFFKPENRLLYVAARQKLKAAKQAEIDSQIFKVVDRIEAGLVQIQEDILKCT